MPKSGPAELKAYHQQVLEAEARKGKRKMAQTDFNPLEIDNDAFAAAQERLAKIVPATTTEDEKIVYVKASVPAAPVPATSAPEPEQKRTRTTVNKLLQKYQERVESLVADIDATEKNIAVLQSALDEKRFKLGVWREAIAEIEKD